MSTEVARQVDNDVKENEENSLEVHMLQNSWTYYIFVFNKSGKWEDCNEKVATFSSIEQFWSILTHTVRPSKMINGNDLYMFKTGIEPKWEDPKNEKGGRWLITISQNHDVDRLWEDLLMLMIGSDWDTDEADEQVCGAVFQPRARGHKMSVWLTNDWDEPTIMEIGKRIKERLHLEDNIYFQPVPDQKACSRGRDVLVGKYQV